VPSDAFPIRPAPDPDNTPIPAPVDPVAHLRGRPEAGGAVSLTKSLEPLLVDIAGLVRLLGRSRASLERDLAAGRLPDHIRLCGSRKWRYSEIAAWVEAGCPHRRAWEAMKTVKNASGRPRRAGR
jgi:predicted DNA-binding transcriptional regulator AlpA